jgi:ubiquitin-protein ligase
MSELARLKAQPHPSVDVYPCADRLDFWNVVVVGPQGSLYERGAFLLGMDFPSDYPSSPPNLRFMTPIRHANVNRHGKVCHQILEGDYGTDVTCRAILDQVYGLLMFPDIENATDSNLAALFHSHPEQYRQAIEDSVRGAARASRDELREALLQEME